MRAAGNQRKNKKRVIAKKKKKEPLSAYICKRLIVMQMPCLLGQWVIEILWKNAEGRT
jgi:hypothetical protein